MDDQFNAYCEKKIAMKQRAYHVLNQTGSIRREWKCEDCGAVLQWDSYYDRKKHRQSRKHSLKAELKL